MDESTLSSERLSERALALLEPVIYGDIFDYPLTLDEVHRYCRLQLTTAQLRSELEGDAVLRELVAFADGYYFLRGRKELVATRRNRKVVSQRAWRTARRVVRYTKYVPFVRSMLVTGSLAVDNARRSDDVDFLVLVHPGRLWSVFCVLGILQRLGLGRWLCVNYYLSMDHLRLSRQTAFIARQMLQARPAAGAASYQQLLAANRWAYDLFPNSASGPSRSALTAAVEERRGVGRRLADLAEWALRGRLGNGLEALLAQALKHRLKVHYGKHDRDVPAAVLQRAVAGAELRFHGNDYEHRAAEQMHARVAELRERLSKRARTSPGISAQE